jgi:hypothetical protein
MATDPHAESGPVVRVVGGRITELERDAASGWALVDGSG